MGNYICFCKSNRIESNYECLICWKKITEQNLIKCVYCNITLHVECEKLYKKNKNYCKCPHCQRISTLCLYSSK